MAGKPDLRDGFIIITMDWDELKALVTGKALRIQYVDHGSAIFAFALDANIFYYTDLPAPGFEPGGSDAAAKLKLATDRREFVNNFLSSANQRISPV